MSAVRCVWPVAAVLGEGPMWSARENAVYFVDIKGPAVHRYGLADGARDSWPMPEPIGWLLERSGGPGFIAGFMSGFAALELEPLAIRPIGDPEPEHPGNRLNDAKVDPYGRIWAGSMDDAEVAPSGALHRLEPDLTWRRVDDGYRVANGPAFSPDGRFLYHTDSALRTVYRFALGEDGTLGPREPFIVLGEGDGYPDGMTTDAQGGLWIAHWDGGRISRYTPEGRLDRAIAMPVSRPTSCAFAGASLDRMFVSSAAIGKPDEPLAGGLFEVETGAAGWPARAFAG